MKSLEYRLERQPELKKLYQDTIKVDVEKGFVKILKQAELEAAKLERQWYEPHHPVQNPNKPGNVSRVCNAASKFRGISLNDNLDRTGLTAESNRNHLQVQRTKGRRHRRHSGDVPPGESTTGRL